MIPTSQQYAVTAIEAVMYPSYTYRLDFQSKRILGMTDGLDAVLQAVVKIINTERFAYVIYSELYGIEIEPLIGKGKDLTRAVIKNRVTDALTVDDRIERIDNFEIMDVDNESIEIKFDVISVYGIVGVGVTVENGR